MNIRDSNPDAGVRIFLIEFTIAVLIFALCSALCLSAFAGSWTLSENTAKLDRAVLLAEERAEELKASHVPATLISENLPEDDLRLTVIPAEGNPGLAKAKIQAFDRRTGKRIHEMTVAWQIEILEASP